MVLASGSVSFGIPQACDQSSQHQSSQCLSLPRQHQSSQFQLPRQTWFVFDVSMAFGGFNNCIFQVAAHEAKSQDNYA